MIVEEDNRRLMALEIEPLSEVRNRSLRQMTIHIDLNRSSQDTAAALQQLIDAHSGDCGVELVLEHSRQVRIRIDSQSFVRIQPSTRLFQQIENICGAGSVVLGPSR